MTAADKKTLRRWTRLVCDALGLSKAPALIFDRSRLRTSTTMAALKSDGSRICVRDDIDKGPDLYFAIAHELRHAWQLEKRPAMFENYQASDELDIVAYNLQPAELDANAFGALVMRDAFGIEPLFEGLPDEVRSAIRAAEAKIEI